jgi:hypothetical protein
MAPSTQIVRVQQRITDLGLPASTFARVCGLTPSALSQAMRGVIQLSGPVEKKLADASVRLTQIENAIRPLALPVHADMLKQILEHVEKNPESVAALGTVIRGIFNGGVIDCGDYGSTNGSEQSIVK